MSNLYDNGNYNQQYGNVTPQMNGFGTVQGRMGYPEDSPNITAMQTNYWGTGTTVRGTRDIANLTHEELLMSGNATYMKLFLRCAELERFSAIAEKAEVEAERWRKLCERLTEQLANIPTSQSAASSSASSASLSPVLQNTSLRDFQNEGFLPSANTPAEALRRQKEFYRILFQDSFAAAEPQTRKTDFPNINFWTRADFKKWSNVNSRHGNNGSRQKGMRVAFLEDGNGDRLSETRIANIRGHISKIFRQVKSFIPGLIAPVWTSVDPEFRQALFRDLRHHFPEFSLCHDDWKAKSFASLWYSDNLGDKKPLVKSEPNEDDIGGESEGKEVTSKKRQRSEAPLRPQKKGNANAQITHQSQSIIIKNPLIANSKMTTLQQHVHYGNSTNAGPSTASGMQRSSVEGNLEIEVLPHSGMTFKSSTLVARTQTPVDSVNDNHTSSDSFNTRNPVNEDNNRTDLEVDDGSVERMNKEGNIKGASPSMEKTNEGGAKTIDGASPGMEKTDEGGGAKTVDGASASMEKVNEGEGADEGGSPGMEKTIEGEVRTVEGAGSPGGGGVVEGASPGIEKTVESASPGMEKTSEGASPGMEKTSEGSIGKTGGTMTTAHGIAENQIGPDPALSFDKTIPDITQATQASISDLPAQDNAPKKLYKKRITDSLTPKNLCTSEWIKRTDHQGTSEEFEKHWAGLGKSGQQHWENLSKERRSQKGTGEGQSEGKGKGNQRGGRGGRGGRGRGRGGRGGGGAGPGPEANGMGLETNGMGAKSS
ncbi:hypothetical protein M378DRAFT_15333 [Amanita muscaria Koide BX008]|uniref:Uncharacterized protein n=1 Tax=Amanita muscaria (strain Koide BX008) TaxID=946122 RepID=A0A0C2WQZ1_AMAMK|nr:hypothetical protein M378DRAFT_15333 [Amanita muscaria Koide BX008]